MTATPDTEDAGTDPLRRPRPVGHQRRSGRQTIKTGWLKPGTVRAACNISSETGRAEAAGLHHLPARRGVEVRCRPRRPPLNTQVTQKWNIGAPAWDVGAHAPPRRRDSVMGAFSADTLISLAFICAIASGTHVPNATIMSIQFADRPACLSSTSFRAGWGGKSRATACCWPIICCR